MEQVRLSGQTAPIRRGQKTVSKKTLMSALAPKKTKPRKIGNGEVSFIASTALDYQPFAWDTNMFYARLGLTPEVSRLDIVRAFQEAPRDTNEESLYYATSIRTILSKSARFRYDRVPLGSFFADDPDLDRVRTEVPEEPEPEDLHSWAHYADPCVGDEEASEWDSSEIRSALAKALAPYSSSSELDVVIGVGVTRTDPRWEQIGFLPIFFVGIDTEVTDVYAEQVASIFIDSTT